MNFIIIPENTYGIEPGNYGRNEFAQLMRDYSGTVSIILFLADMLEE